MVVAELKHIECPDFEFFRRNENTEADDYLLVQAIIGPRGTHVEESFQFLVYTPAALSLKVEKPGAHFFCKDVLLVREIDLDLVRAALNELCGSITGSTWPEVASKLGRYGEWEFENYQEHLRV